MLLRETQTIELKESWQDRYLETISAFANTNGGTFYIGVSDKGNAVDLKNTKHWLESLPNKILNTLQLTTSIELEQYQGKDIIKITIPYKPLVSYNGVFFHRVGSTTQELKGVELQRLLLEINNLHWDETIMRSADVTVNDIDTDTVEHFVKLATAKGRLPENVDGKNIKKLFRNLDLINEDGQLTRGAILLFGKKPTRFFKNAIIKIGRFRGEDSSDIIIHDQLEGNLFDQYDKSMEILKSKYLWSPISYKDSIRLETLEIPEIALREMLLNAMIHKDYTTPTAISIRIFESRVSVWNAGELTQLSVEDLKKEHDSFKRNPLLADILFRAGFIEAWGRGTNAIVKECVEDGLDEPIFTERQGGLEVSIKRDPMRLSDKGVDKSAETINAPIKGLSPRQQKIVTYAQEHGSVTNSICQELTGASKRTVTNDLTDLVNNGILQKNGTSGSNIWYEPMGQSGAK